MENMMIRITRKPQDEAKTLTLDDVHEWVAECDHAGIDGGQVVSANVTMGQKLKMLAVEG